MRQRMKKISLCFVTAFAVLTSILTTSGTVMAAEEGMWVPFVQDGEFLHPSEFVKSDIPGFDYDSWYEGMVSYNISDDGRYRIRIVKYEGTENEYTTLWQEVPMSQVYIEDFGVYAYEFKFDTTSMGMSGNLILQVQSLAGQTAAGLINEAGFSFGDEPFSIYIESNVKVGSDSLYASSAFENGQFLNFNLDAGESEGTNFLYYHYGERAPVPKLRPSPTGKYLISYNNEEYVVTPTVEENWTGSVETYFKDDSGRIIAEMFDAEKATSGTNNSMFIASFDYVPGSTFSMTIYEPDFADLPTFFESATALIGWLLSMFSTLLVFMLKNPICFIGLIASLIVVVVKILQGTTGNK